MNIQPPQNAVGVNVPLPPANPPTALDVQIANAYIAHLNTAYVVQNASANSVMDISAAQEYHQALIAARAGPAVAPPWFAPAIAQALAPIEQKLIKLHNGICGEGYRHPYDIVLFADGSHPVQDHNLPVLANHRDVTNLTHPQITAYLDGYNINVPGGATFDAKRVLIAHHIGSQSAGL